MSDAQVASKDTTIFNQNYYNTPHISRPDVFSIVQMEIFTQVSAPQHPLGLSLSLSSFFSLLREGDKIYQNKKYLLGEAYNNILVHKQNSKG